MAAAASVSSGQHSPPKCHVYIEGGEQKGSKCYWIKKELTLIWFGPHTPHSCVSEHKKSYRNLTDKILWLTIQGLREVSWLFLLKTKPSICWFVFQSNFTIFPKPNWPDDISFTVEYNYLDACFIVHVPSWIYSIVKYNSKYTTWNGWTRKGPIYLLIQWHLEPLCFQPFDKYPSLCVGATEPWNTNLSKSRSKNVAYFKHIIWNEAHWGMNAKEYYLILYLLALWTLLLLSLDLLLRNLTKASRTALYQKLLM